MGEERHIKWRAVTQYGCGILGLLCVFVYGEGGGKRCLTGAGNERSRDGSGGVFKWARLAGTSHTAIHPYDAVPQCRQYRQRAGDAWDPV